MAEGLAMKEPAAIAGRLIAGHTRERSLDLVMRAPLAAECQGKLERDHFSQRL